eukprot:GEMP01025815.1.p1 GENE.GEMP01025815.1~~GEMP01025815.1.p1  ORF type:complete len:487 (+),score=89.34 GEMP01025815.1:178-1638(+)
MSGNWSAVGFQFSSWHPLSRREKFPIMVPTVPKIKEKDPESDSQDLDPFRPVIEDNRRERLAFRRYVQRIRSSHQPRHAPMHHSARLHSDNHGRSPSRRPAPNVGVVQERATACSTPRQNGAKSAWVHSSARFPSEPNDDAPPVGLYHPVFKFVLPRTPSASLTNKGRDTYSPLQSPRGDTRSRSPSPAREDAVEKGSPDGIALERGGHARKYPDRLEQQKKASVPSKKASNFWDKTSSRWKGALHSSWQPADPYAPDLLSQARRPASFSFGRAERDSQEASAPSTLAYHVNIRSKSPCANFSQAAEREGNIQRQGFWEKRVAELQPDRLAEHNDHDCVRVKTSQAVDFSKTLGRGSLFQISEDARRPVTAPKRCPRDQSMLRSRIEEKSAKRGADTWFAFRKISAPASNCAKSPRTKHALMKQLSKVRNHHDQVLFECEMLSEWFDWRRNLERNLSDELPARPKTPDSQGPLPLPREVRKRRSRK